jgi:Fur family ferric uptake transcriptional regulator
MGEEYSRDNHDGRSGQNGLGKLGSQNGRGKLDGQNGLGKLGGQNGLGGQSGLPAGVKRTRQREGVLAVLEGARRPLSAPEIHAKIRAGAAKGEEGEDGAWMSTVYRVLALLVKSGVVTKLSLSGNGTALYELNRPKHRHYAVCLACHKVVGVEDDCPLEEYVPKLTEKEFQVTGHSLEVFGYCKDCQRP